MKSECIYFDTREQLENYFDFIVPKVQVLFEKFKFRVICNKLYQETIEGLNVSIREYKVTHPECMYGIEKVCHTVGAVTNSCRVDIDVVFGVGNRRLNE